MFVTCLDIFGDLCGVCLVLDIVGGRWNSGVCVQVFNRFPCVLIAVLRVLMCLNAFGGLWRFLNIFKGLSRFKVFTCLWRSLEVFVRSLFVL